MITGITSSITSFRNLNKYEPGVLKKTPKVRPWKSDCELALNSQGFDCSEQRFDEKEDWRNAERPRRHQNKPGIGIAHQVYIERGTSGVIPEIFFINWVKTWGQLARVRDNPAKFAPNRPGIFALTSSSRAMPDCDDDG